MIGRSNPAPGTAARPPSRRAGHLVVDHQRVEPAHDPRVPGRPRPTSPARCPSPGPRADPQHQPDVLLIIDDQEPEGHSRPLACVSSSPLSSVPVVICCDDVRTPRRAPARRPGRPPEWRGAGSSPSSTRPCLASVRRHRLLERLGRLGILESLREALIAAYALGHRLVEGEHGLLEPALAPGERRPCAQRQLYRRPSRELVVESAQFPSGVNRSKARASPTSRCRR